MKLKEREVVCACGEWTGERCQWRGPVGETVVVEYMPVHLRASHIAAGNAGIYPYNGAVRVRVHCDCAEMLLADENERDWSRIVDA